MLTSIDRCCPRARTLPPLQVVFDEVDPRDPFQFSHRRKWAITWTACTYTILVSWALSCYSIASADMQRDLGLSNLGSAAGISLCVPPT